LCFDADPVDQTAIEEGCAPFLSIMAPFEVQRSKAENGIVLLTGSRGLRRRLTPDMPLGLSTGSSAQRKGFS
jgi:hypothetical protein